MLQFNYAIYHSGYNVPPSYSVFLSPLRLCVSPIVGARVIKTAEWVMAVASFLQKYLTRPMNYHKYYYWLGCHVLPLQDDEDGDRIYDLSKDAVQSRRPTIRWSEPWHKWFDEVIPKNYVKCVPMSLPNWQPQRP